VKVGTVGTMEAIHPLTEHVGPPLRYFGFLLVRMYSIWVDSFEKSVQTKTKPGTELN